MKTIGRADNGNYLVEMNEAELSALRGLVNVCGETNKTRSDMMGITPDWGPIEDWIDAVVRFVSVQYVAQRLSVISQALLELQTKDTTERSGHEPALSSSK